MSRMLSLEEDDLSILYSSLCCLENNKFISNKFKKRKIDELKEKVRPYNANQREFGVPLLNERDFNK